MLDEPMLPLPPSGRVFRQRRRVHLGDASPGGRLRLDALARFLQDVSNEDTRDAAFPDLMGWVVRRTVVEICKEAVFGEQLELATFCSGIGGRWAERTVVVTGDQGADIAAATLWVHVDLETFRPLRLPASFHDLFAEAAGGRTVRARLVLPGPPADTVGAARPFPLRFADFDVLGHLNNATSWVAVEEELARRRGLRAPMRAAVEFVRDVQQGDAVSVVAVDREDALELWLVDDTGDVRSAAKVWRRI